MWCFCWMHCVKVLFHEILVFLHVKNCTFYILLNDGDDWNYVSHVVNISVFRSKNLYVCYGCVSVFEILNLHFLRIDSKQPTSWFESRGSKRNWIQKKNYVDKKFMTKHISLFWNCFWYKWTHNWCSSTWNQTSINWPVWLLYKINEFVFISDSS